MVGPYLLELSVTLGESQIDSVRLGFFDLPLA